MDDFKKYLEFVRRFLWGGRLRRLSTFFFVSLIITVTFVYIFINYIYYPAPSAARSQKRLLEWGWNTPRLQDIRQYLNQAQTTPFNGLIFDIETPTDSRGLSWRIFSDQRVDQAMLDQLLVDLDGIEWGRLTDNFLRVNTYTTLDWFDDYSATVENLEAVARLANQLGFNGIMLDTEQYPGVIVFEYAQQSNRDQYTYEEYDAQAFQRGQEVMQALNRGYPGITVLYTFGLTVGSQRDAPRDLSQHRYGLLMPFIEGMMAAADDGTILVDAFEGSYIYQHEDQFLAAYKLIKGLTRDFYARDPERYGEKMQAGFGLWLDHNYCNEPGLTPQNCPSGFTPEMFADAVGYALRYSDRYVWIYSQGVNWYTGEGIPPEWQAVFDSLGQ
jgi:hypothetical protein